MMFLDLIEEPEENRREENKQTVRLDLNPQPFRCNATATDNCVTGEHGTEMPLMLQWKLRPLFASQET